MQVHTPGTSPFAGEYIDTKSYSPTTFTPTSVSMASEALTPINEEPTSPSPPPLSDEACLVASKSHEEKPQTSLEKLLVSTMTTMTEELEEVLKKFDVTMSPKAAPPARSMSPDANPAEYKGNLVTQVATSFTDKLISNTASRISSARATKEKVSQPVSTLIMHLSKAINTALENQGTLQVEHAVTHESLIELTKKLDVLQASHNELAINGNQQFANLHELIKAIQAAQINIENATPPIAHAFGKLSTTLQRHLTAQSAQPKVKHISAAAMSTGIAAIMLSGAGLAGFTLFSSQILAALGSLAFAGIVASACIAILSLFSYAVFTQGNTMLEANRVLQQTTQPVVAKSFLSDIAAAANLPKEVSATSTPATPTPAAT